MTSRFCAPTTPAGILKYFSRASGLHSLTFTPLHENLSFPQQTGIQIFPRQMEEAESPREIPPLQGAKP